MRDGEAPNGEKLNPVPTLQTSEMVRNHLTGDFQHLDKPVC